MLFRFAKLWIAVGLLVAMWGLSTVRQTETRTWLRPAGAQRGPVRIIQFYANVGILSPGEKALLCYGVENAKSVRISPTLQGVYPSVNRCVEIVPAHTTHYTILAEGYDGRVATRSFTLAVEDQPSIPEILHYAERPGEKLASW
jgi:hypothetical protein